MTKKFKPMLAGKVEAVENLTYPVMVSPKLDGIRCLIVDGQPVSRRLKSIPNKFIFEQLKGLPDGLDGELMVKGDFNSVQSAVMAFEGEPNFTYMVFDNFTYKGGFKERYTKLCGGLQREAVVPHQIVTNPKELMTQYDFYMAKGYEGLMVRSLDGPYKFGRSTTKEGTLLKLKKFLDDEGVVTGFAEKFHNTNEAKKNALGHTERSSAKAGKQPAGTLGAIKVHWKNIDFEIGTGLNDAQRLKIWHNRDEYTGKLVKFKYQELSAKKIPRFPVFLGFRHEEDT